jgi:Fe-S cluster assembly protein SufD
MLPLTAGAELPGPAATQEARRVALAALAASGWPSRKREPWRYTDLEPLARAGLELMPAAAGGADVAAAEQMLESLTAAPRNRVLVLLDGQRVAGLGATAIESLELSAPESRWSSFAAGFAHQAPATRYPLAALNTAYTQQGLWVRVPAGTILAEPVHIVVMGSTRAALAAQPRIVIDVEESARITLVQHFVDMAPGTTGWVNGVTQIRQAPSSIVELYRLQRHDASRTHTSLLSAQLAADAELSAFYLDLGGNLVRNDVEVTLAGRGARAELIGLFLAGAGQHIDNHTTIDHAAGETRSAEQFRGIVGNRGHGVFNGKVIVRPGSQRIDATQSSDNLLLGEHAEIDTKPELEIYANDVKCSHGATVGELDIDQLFYLRSRGLDAAAARDLLTTAFAAVIVERLRDESVRTLAQDLVTERLRALGHD